MDKNSDNTKSDFFLLDKFIIQKMKNYKEPERKGTPKGQPIGFSRIKYLAALTSLKNFSLKQQSEILNISHGLLRKWRTEDSFKEQMSKIESDFIFNLVEHLGARGEKQKKLADDYFKKSVVYIARTPPPELTWDEFNDAKHYNSQLVNKIIVAFPEIYKHVSKRIDKITSDFSIDRTDEDILLIAVYAQVTEFLHILKWYPFKKKHKVEILEDFQVRQDNTKNLFNKASLIMLAKEWEDSGTVSELTLKRNIWALHNASGNFTPVEMTLKGKEKE